MSDRQAFDALVEKALTAVIAEQCCADCATDEHNRDCTRPKVVAALEAAGVPESAGYRSALERIESHGSGVAVEIAREALAVNTNPEEGKR